MTGNSTLRDKADESEKITINLGYVDLGRVDLLVQEGFYSNRTDFIRTAIRNQLAAQTEVVKQSIVRHTLELGLRDYSRADLEAVRTPAKSFISKWSDLPALRPTSRPTSPLPPSDQSACSVHFKQAPKSNRR